MDEREKELAFELMWFMFDKGADSFADVRKLKEGMSAPTDKEIGIN